jgi:hypothetical protein
MITVKVRYGGMKGDGWDWKYELVWERLLFPDIKVPLKNLVYRLEVYSWFSDDTPQVMVSVLYKGKYRAVYEVGRRGCRVIKTLVGEESAHKFINGLTRELKPKEPRHEVGYALFQGVLEG